MKEKIEVKTKAPWALYWPGPIPVGTTVLGTVTRADGATGALLRLSSGIYCQGNAGVLRSLPQRDVEASLAASVIGERGGSATSPAKAESSRRNGLLGGRPQAKGVEG